MQKGSNSMADILELCIFVQTLGYIDGLVEDCSISSASAMEIQKSCYEPSILSWKYLFQFNTFSPGQNDRHFTKDIFKYIFFDDSFRILIQI